MEFLRLFIAFIVLFLLTSLLCWVLTCCWFFGPIVTVTFSLGGILLLGWLGVLSLSLFKNEP